MKKRGAFFVAAILECSAGSIYAEPINSAQSPELLQIQSKIQHANQTIAQIKLKRESLIAQLQAIEKQYGTTAGSLRELRLQILGKQQRLKLLSKDMKKRQIELKAQKRELGKQIKASFIMGQKEQLRLLLNQQDPALTSRMIVYYRYLNNSRLKKLADIRSNISELVKLAREKRHEADLLRQTLRSHKTAQVKLTQAQQQRELLLEKLNNDFKEKSRELGLLEDSSTQLQGLIDQLQRVANAREKQEARKPKIIEPKPADDTVNLDMDGNPILATQPKPEAPTAIELTVSKPFAELKGHLPWPVKGAIVKRFGSPRSETRWDGVLISVQEGTDIHAVSSGRVIFADWLRGYGLLIILDHGNSYMTLYAFNQSLYKKVGETVKMGTVIAAAGKSDGREESGLYFGIRNQGKPVDPLKWFKKS